MLDYLMSLCPKRYLVTPLLLQRSHSNMRRVSSGWGWMGVSQAPLAPTRSSCSPSLWHPSRCHCEAIGFLYVGPEALRRHQRYTEGITITTSSPTCCWQKLARKPDGWTAGLLPGDWPLNILFVWPSKGCGPQPTTGSWASQKGGNSQQRRVCSLAMHCRAGV